MTTPEGPVGRLDDNPEMVKALARLLRAKQFEVRELTSVGDFLAADLAQGTACLILDVAMPERNGLEVQQRLLNQGSLAPIIFLTGQGDIPMSVKAIKAGAIDFLTKPVDAAALVKAVRPTLEEAEQRVRGESGMGLFASRPDQRLSSLEP